MHTIDAADTAVVLVLTDQDVLRLERLLLAGVERAGRRNGAISDGDQALVERLQMVARQSRSRLRARSQASRATTIAPRDTDDASCVSSWPTCPVAARTYGVDASHLRRMASRGALPARLGVKGEWRLDPDGLVEWAAGRGNTSHTKAA